MASNEISPKASTAPRPLVEHEAAADNVRRCGKQFRFWRCLACGINWRPDYSTELCEACLARIFPQEH